MRDLKPTVDPDFLADLERSRSRHPNVAKMFDALLGEVHELKRAYAGDGNQRAEAFDVATVAYRIATEGDAGGNEKTCDIPDSFAWGAKAHPDDIAVERFAQAMKAKMARSRAKGRGGWEDPAQCPEDRLVTMLLEHLGKGNQGTFEDIATFAMMLHHRGADPMKLREAVEKAGLRPVPGAVVAAYEIEADPYFPTRIERVTRRDGSASWAVRRGSDVMARDGSFEPEPSPSARDEAFFSRCRFETAQQAYDAWAKTKERAHSSR